jgi:hypothetical protein
VDDDGGGPVAVGRALPLGPRLDLLQQYEHFSC